jgi:hypothetical protein
MSFHKIQGKYAVESDEGFMVDRVGSPLTQFSMRYHEDTKIAEHPIENLVSEAEIPISASLIKGWNPPFDRQLMPQEKRIEIARRICAAMNFLGDKSYVSDTP